MQAADGLTLRSSESGSGMGSGSDSLPNMTMHTVSHHLVGLPN